jgi:hypothetical protein
MLKIYLPTASSRDIITSNLFVFKGKIGGGGGNCMV